MIIIVGNMISDFFVGSNKQTSAALNAIYMSLLMETASFMSFVFVAKPRSGICPIVGGRGGGGSCMFCARLSFVYSTPN